MIIDITLPMTKEALHLNSQTSQASLIGHIGTHFDVMNKSFPLDYCMKQGIVFDVTDIPDRDIEASDIDMLRIQEGMFVLFQTGFSSKHAYGSDTYRHDHPQLSHDLIQQLLDAKVSMIGIDAAGIRRGKEHTPADQLCADHGVFVIENLYELDQLKGIDPFMVYTFPLRYEGITGIPCRVLVETN